MTGVALYLFFATALGVFLGTISRTMAQFALQGAGVNFSSQLLAMLPYVATIVVLAIISRNPTWIRINMPASLGKPFHPGT